MPANNEKSTIDRVTKLREEFDALEAEIASTTHWWMAQMAERAPEVYKQFVQHKRRRQEVRRVLVELAQVVAQVVPSLKKES